MLLRCVHLPPQPGHRPRPTTVAFHFCNMHIQQRKLFFGKAYRKMCFTVKSKTPAVPDTGSSKKKKKSHQQLEMSVSMLGGSNLLNDTLLSSDLHYTSKGTLFFFLFLWCQSLFYMPSTVKLIVMLQFHPAPLF